MTESILGIVDGDEAFVRNEDNSDNSDEDENDEYDWEDEVDGEVDSDGQDGDGADNDEGDWEDEDDDDLEEEGGSNDELPEEDNVGYSSLRYIWRVRIERLGEKDIEDVKREWALHLQLQKDGKVGDESKVYNKEIPLFDQWLENNHEWHVR